MDRIHTAQAQWKQILNYVARVKEKGYDSAVGRSTRSANSLQSQIAITASKPSTIQPTRQQELHQENNAHYVVMFSKSEESIE